MTDLVSPWRVTSDQAAAMDELVERGAPRFRPRDVRAVREAMARTVPSQAVPTVVQAAVLWDRWRRRS